MIGLVMLCALGEVIPIDVNAYATRVRHETWNEIWPDGQGHDISVPVEAEIWSDAIQAALDERQAVSVGNREKPYYLDKPLLLRSGQRLHLGDQAEMRLKPGSNFCMVRNSQLISGEAGPVAISEDADSDIALTGGIWTTLATSATATNDNVRARADAADTFRSHGVLLFSNVKHLRIENVTIRQCKPHGIQLSNCSDFVVEHVRFEDQRRDGVHINGPADHGAIRDIRNAKGWMGDDLVALNAWDWKNTSMTFGPIHHIVVEEVNGSSTDLAQSGEADTRSEIRLLAGTKRFDNGAALACDIHDCEFIRIAGVRTFKMYDQPNLEIGRDNDFADPIGALRDLRFTGIAVERPTGAPLFQIALDGAYLTIRDVRLAFNPFPVQGESFVLTQVGPLSQTCKVNPADPNTWVEIFSPDKDCVVSGLDVANVTARLGEGSEETPVDPARLIRTIQQQPNPDYPNTTPRGGTGRGILK